MEAPPFHCKDEVDSNSSGSHSLSEQEEPTGAPAPASSLPAGPPPDTKLINTASTAPPRATPSSSSPSPKRSGRRSVHKRVVSIPIVDTADGSRGGKGSGEGAPPSDSWAWRKYGQKPIKGSPYPRGYYRCSSSKGCPARKQVERSRVDPTMLLVTYACEHNHSWPLPKNTTNHHQHPPQQPPSPVPSRSPPKQPLPEGDTDAALLPVGHPITSSPGVSAEESFATDLLGEEPSLQAMMADEFGWFSDVSASPPPVEGFLGSPMYGGAAVMPLLMDDDDDVELGGSGDGAGDEESALFAGLGELPECAVVFRRVRMQMEAAEDGRRVAAAPCCGTTG